MATELKVSKVRGKNVATRLVNEAPLKLIPTASLKDEFRVMTSSYGGGVLQGDQVEFNIVCEASSSLLLQAQGNQHLYRNNDSTKESFQRITAKVEDGARVVVIPEPTVMHAEASFEQVQTWDLTKESELILIDILHVGRSENGEEFLYKKFRSDVCLKLNGETIYLDCFLSKPHESKAHQASRFGDYKLMLNMFSFGKKAHACHEDLMSIYETPEVKHIRELPSSKYNQSMSQFCATSLDTESQIMTTRAMFTKRKEVDRFTKSLMDSLKESFY